jgi:hypothetical protein
MQQHHNTLRAQMQSTLAVGRSLLWGLAELLALLRARAR